jgi:L-ornithine Nalpha-acyltransferase
MLSDMPDLSRGRYSARIAASAGDLAEARALRRLTFGVDAAGADRFDDICTHVLVRDGIGGALVCCFRLLMLERGADVAHSYSAQFYDLSALAQMDGRMAELGRFCVHPEAHDPDILRVAWGAMAAFVDAGGIAMLFGCSSFAGTGTARYLDAFAMLGARYLAPARWSPGVKAAEVFRFAARMRDQPDARKAMQAMPPLLKSYLMIGGRVSDHAVVDRQMNTLHVFTGVEIAAIPEARKKLLRAVAG